MTNESAARLATLSDRCSYRKYEHPLIRTELQALGGGGGIRHHAGRSFNARLELRWQKTGQESRPSSLTRPAGLLIIDPPVSRRQNPPPSSSGWG